MRNVLIAVGATAIAMLIQIQPAPAQEGATVVNEFNCGIAAGDWAGGINLVTTEVTHFTGTPNGQAILQCLFDIPEGYEPRKAERITDFECGTPLGVTYDTESISTPGGKVHLRCVIH